MNHLDKRERKNQVTLVAAECTYNPLTEWLSLSPSLSISVSRALFVEWIRRKSSLIMTRHLSLTTHFLSSSLSLTWPQWGKCRKRERERVACICVRKSESEIGEEERERERERVSEWVSKRGWEMMSIQVRWVPVLCMWETVAWIIGLICILRSYLGHTMASLSLEQ